MSKKFEIINTDIICSWTYNLSKNTDCAICYNSLSCSSVPDFQKGNDSSIRIGNCGHSFHFGCITPWVRSNPRCPLCSQPWVDATPERYCRSIEINKKDKTS